MRVTTHLLPLGVLLLSPYRAEGKLQTVFVDDALGDSQTGALPTFLPSEAGFSQGPLCQGCGDAWCQGCNFQPDPAKAHGGTWKVATHFKNDPQAKYITFDFVGTEVEIFCILPNLPSSSNIVSRSYFDFRIDLELPPNGDTIFDHVSDSSGTYQYNVSVFHQTGLTNEKHTIMVRAVRPDIDAVLVFDYATYVFDDETLGTSSSSTTSQKSTKPPATVSHTSVSSTLTQSSVDSSIPPTTSSTSSLGPLHNQTATPSTSSLHNQTAAPSTSSLHNQTADKPTPSPVSTTIQSQSLPSSSHGTTLSTQHDSSSVSTGNRPKHLSVILGSVFGALSAVVLGAFLVYRFLLRTKTGSGQLQDRDTVRPFSLQIPSIPKNREKSSPGAFSTSTSSMLEGDPPMYSQHGFQLT